MEILHAASLVTGEEFQCIQLNSTRTVGVGPWVKLFHVYLLIDYGMVHTFVNIRHNTQCFKVH